MCARHVRIMYGGCSTASKVRLLLQAVLCEICAPGHYCEGGHSGGKNGPCPRGTWNPDRGSTSSAACRCCPVGALMGLRFWAVVPEVCGRCTRSWLAGCQGSRAA